MSATFHIEIATPEKLVIANAVTEAQIPGSEGMLGFLPGHAALISEIDAGELSYVMDGHRTILAVSKGWVEISNDRCRVLVETCENAGQIDVARAEAALKRANDLLASPKQDLDMARALLAAKKARARLNVARGY